MVFNTTFNDISVISWRSVLLVEETRRKTIDLLQVTDNSPEWDSNSQTNQRTFYLSRWHCHSKTQWQILKTMVHSSTQSISESSFEGPLQSLCWQDNASQCSGVLCIACLTHRDHTVLCLCHFPWNYFTSCSLNWFIVHGT